MLGQRGRKAMADAVPCPERDMNVLLMYAASGDAILAGNKAAHLAACPKCQKALADWRLILRIVEEPGRLDELADRLRSDEPLVEWPDD
jgi:hypothetical protein